MNKRPNKKLVVWLADWSFPTVQYVQDLHSRIYAVHKYRYGDSDMAQAGQSGGSFLSCLQQHYSKGRRRLQLPACPARLPSLPAQPACSPASASSLVAVLSVVHMSCEKTDSNVVFAIRSTCC
jgi:hypothetical protein